MTDFILTEANLNTPDGVLASHLTLKTVLKEYGICCFYLTGEGKLVVAHPSSLTINREHEEKISSENLEIFGKAKSEAIDQKIRHLLAEGKTDKEIEEVIDELPNMRK